VEGSSAQRLLDLCTAHQPQIIDRWDAALRRISAFAQTPSSETRKNVEVCFDAFMCRLDGGGDEALQEFVSTLAERRFATGFHLHAPIAAASRFRTAVTEVFGAANVADDPDLNAEIDALLDAFNQRFSSAFASRIVAAREDRLRELFAWAPEMFFRVSESGALQDANSAFEAFFSVSRAEWKGAQLEAVDEKLDDLSEIIVPLFTSGPSVKGSLRLKGKDGAMRLFEARAHASEVDGQSSAVVMLRDVTAEQALRAHVIQSEKLASIGQVAASVAHELNNPLTWVVSNIELALEELGSVPSSMATEFRVSLSEALVGARRMAGIVRDLRTFARNERDEATKFDLGETLEVALKIAGPQVHRLVDIERRYGEVGTLRGFPGRISQVVVNLVVNAGQACEGMGRRGHLRIETRLDGGNVVVDVLDDGPGIKPEIEERLFEPFVTSKGAKGTGLGLWTSRTLIEGLGGALVYERVRDWTRFRITFPRDATPGRAAPRVTKQVTLSRGTVLVVDDEPAVVRVLERRLDRSGVNVLTATGASQALTVLEENGGRVAAVLCDLSMPEMDGLQLASEMLRRWPGLETRVLFMSGAPDVMGRLEANQRCFEKPVKFDAVLGALRDLGC